MAKTAKVQEQSLESIMWNCRNALRGTVGGNEKNRDAVMGLVFLKFAGNKFEKRCAELAHECGDVPANLWLIPKDAEKPNDQRKSKREDKAYGRQFL